MQSACAVLCCHLWPVRLYNIIPHYLINSGFGGLGVACWPLVLEFAGSNSAAAVGFFGRKNPQHAFLRRGSKTVCRALRHVKETKSDVEVATFGKILDHFSPIVPPSAAGFASVASDARDLLWRKLERSKSLILLQVEGLTCRWQRHSVKPSCWECSTTVGQAETQLSVVVSIEEEDYLINGTIFCKMLLNIKCVLSFSTTFAWNVSHSKKNSARYD
jgi:hypothetical protein